MDTTMTLEIKADWQALPSAPLEERVAYGAIGIRFNDLWLTEAEDEFVKQIRQQVYLSGYRLAEWLAWNWWRLRWEPRRKSFDWSMAHRLSTIGGGYVWPNITIVSDGERVLLNAEPTAAHPSEPIRYICKFAAIVRASDFERAVDSFVDEVANRLREVRVADTNLQLIWADVLADRSTSERTKRKKLEALLGYDTDESDKAEIDRLISEAQELGEPAVDELAADRTGDAKLATSAEIKDMAKRAGYDSNPRDAARLEDKSIRALPVDVAAWKRGVSAAAALRQQEGLGADPVSNQKLCQIAGVSNQALSRGGKSAELSFTLDESSTKGAVVLRSKFETGRRFTLARLTGDRVATLGDGQLRPATRTYTYRQKLQRAFAGEFLCPFNTMADMLQGDFSAEAIEDVANHFNVSDRTVRTLLVNHKLIDRDELIGDFDLAAA